MKRLLDILLGGSALLALLVPMLVVALLVRARMGSPVLFRQTRPGLDERPFEMLKFRTMLDGPGCDADRLTPLGRFLRLTSLDELPELWNIVRGDMSLVGPRPLLMEYLPLYTPEQRRRHAVRPGLTGLAQVSGRNAVNWHDRFALDLWYVDHRSIRLDLWIMMMTVRQLLRGSDVNAPGEATMARFDEGCER